MITDKWLAQTLRIPIDVARIINQYRGRMEIKEKTAALEKILGPNTILREWVTSEDMYIGDAGNVGDLYRCVSGLGSARTFEDLFGSLQSNKWAFHENTIPIDLFPIIQILLLAMTAVNALYEAAYETSSDIGCLYEPDEYTNRVTALSEVYMEVLDTIGGQGEAWDKFLQKLIERTPPEAHMLDTFLKS